MTGSRCLLDTSVIIQAFRKDNAIVQRLDELAEVFVPIIVIGELLYGAFKSSNSKRNIEQILNFLESCTIAELNVNTAINYGKIKAELQQKGKPIPENDIWIAAVAQQYQLSVFTTDNHFQEIDAITLF